MIPSRSQFVLFFFVISLAVTALGQSNPYCGMRDYYYKATGAELPNAANVVGDTIAHDAAHAERHDERINEDTDGGNQTAVDVDGAVALGGAAVSAIDSIARAKERAHYMEVYNNIHEALEYKRDPTTTDTADLTHTLGIINNMKDATGTKYNYTLAQLGRAVLDAGKSGAYCGDGDNLLVTDKFRAVVLDKLLNPTPPPPPPTSDGSGTTTQP